MIKAVRPEAVIFCGKCDSKPKLDSVKDLSHWQTHIRWLCEMDQIPIHSCELVCKRLEHLRHQIPTSHTPALPSFSRRMKQQSDRMHWVNHLNQSIIVIMLHGISEVPLIEINHRFHAFSVKMICVIAVDIEFHFTVGTYTPTCTSNQMKANIKRDCSAVIT